LKPNPTDVAGILPAPRFEVLKVPTRTEVLVFYFTKKSREKSGEITISCGEKCVFSVITAVFLLCFFITTTMTGPHQHGRRANS
jgi:hypothetical protein